MSKYIEHDGIIVAQVATGKYTIKITQQSACATCQAAALCNAAESKEKIIEAISTDTTLSVGDDVIVYGRMALGYKALVLAVIIPMFIALTVLFIAMHYTHNELTSGIAALGAMLPYYLILMLLRHKLQRVFVFSVKRKQ